MQASVTEKSSVLLLGSYESAPQTRGDLRRAETRAKVALLKAHAHRSWSKSHMWPIIHT